MKLNKLRQLKEKLIEDKDLSKIWDFYMDEFADRPEFLDYGQPTANPFLEAVVPAVCRSIFGREMKITHLLIIHIPEYQFYHAPFSAEKRMGGVIYFADNDKGLLAVTAHFPPTAEVKYSRFTKLPHQ
jgi:hypothetical protein